MWIHKKSNQVCHSEIEPIFKGLIVKQKGKSPACPSLFLILNFLMENTKSIFEFADNNTIWICEVQACASLPDGRCTCISGRSEMVSGSSPAFQVIAGGRGP